jgi:hypothetical protein
MLCNINFDSKPQKKVTGVYHFYSPKLQLPKETVRLLGCENAIYTNRKIFSFSLAFQ